MSAPENRPLALENQACLEALQAEGQVIGRHGERMRDAKFWTIGLVVYRCDYSDDALWERYLANLRKEADEWFKRHKQDRTTALYYKWTIFEDREALHGASKLLVRDKHAAWRDEMSVERDGPGADRLYAKAMPRFTFALHVGRDSLDTLVAYEVATWQNLVPNPLWVTVALVHVPFTSWPPTNDSDEEYEEDMDNTEDEDDPDRPGSGLAVDPRLRSVQRPTDNESGRMSREEQKSA
ncbi:uncharacterized protein B0I36DRAFT_358413 [Microdochium trichocladiopsis]|uniref:Uncharacterized protein n=1 Tax=Microdochium trichocladiopsis TaxID=1682393 RepID=A0A9P8YJ55_9PEZI|nr:uncharacterized protein B0I36DRAFT_358413 [Microdochium trichocladiopsis]KAH7041225.1 hypothetical protein B0I36DRAFT_358413 [Microdochium trichocladiopsis]